MNISSQCYYIAAESVRSQNLHNFSPCRLKKAEAGCRVVLRRIWPGRRCAARSAGGGGAAADTAAGRGSCGSVAVSTSPLTHAAAAFLNSYFYRFLFLGPGPGSPGANDQPGTVSQLWGPSASRCNRGASIKCVNNNVVLCLK